MDKYIIPTIDGALNPSEVPDIVAYSLLFRLLSGRKTKEEIRNAIAYIKYKNLGDPQQLLAVAEEYRERIDDLQRRATTVISGKEQIQPSNFDPGKFAIISEIINSLPRRLAKDNGFNKLRKHINEGVKPKVKIYTGDALRQPNNNSSPFQIKGVSFLPASLKKNAIVQGGASINNYGESWSVDNSQSEYSPDNLPQNTLLVGAGITETNFYYGQPTEVKTDINSPDGRTTTITSQGTTYTRAETNMPIYDENLPFPEGDGYFTIPIYHSVFFYGYGPQCYQYGTEGPCPNYMQFYTLVQVAYSAFIVYHAYRYLGVEAGLHAYGPTCIATFPCTKTRRYEGSYRGDYQQCRGLRIQIFAAVFCISACIGQNTEGYCT